MVLLRFCNKSFFYSKSSQTDLGKYAILDLSSNISKIITKHKNISDNKNKVSISIQSVQLLF